MSIIPALDRWNQGSHKFKIILDYMKKLRPGLHEITSNKQKKRKESTCLPKIKAFYSLFGVFAALLTS